MRARLYDRRGPPTSWRVFLSLAATCAALSLMKLACGGEVGQELLAVGAFLALAVLAPARFAPRDVSLEVGFGEVRVRGSLFLGQSVRARDVIGASTARQDDGFLVSVQTTKRAAHPISFLVETEADAAKLRAALGVGHDGAGELAWRTNEPSLVATGNVLGWIAFAAFAAHMIPRSEDNFMALAGLWYGTLPLLLALVRLRSPPTIRVLLRPEALYLPDASGVRRVAYQELAEVTHLGRQLRLKLHDGAELQVMLGVQPEAELSLLTAQIENARRRAAGEASARHDVSDRLANLERRGEPVPAWLARLDGLAAGASIGGYRSAQLDRDALWVALEDADTSAELRLATARVLRQIEPERRTRIAELAATSRSPEVARGLRVACEVDDVAAVADAVIDVWGEFDATEVSARRAARETR